MESLCLFSFGVLLVTVVGHGIWLLFAKIFASLRQEGRSAREERPDRCRNCREMIPYHARRCPGCGLTRNAGAEAADLRIMANQLEAFRDAGEIDGETYSRMLDMIDARQRKLRERGTSRRRLEPAEPREDRPPPRIEPREQQPELRPTREEVPSSAAPSIETPPSPEPTREPEIPSQTQAREPVEPQPAFPEPVRDLVPNVEGVAPVPDRSRDIAGEPIPPPPAVRPALSRGPFVPPDRAPQPDELEKPRVSWGEWLGAFLEKRNIFWGELVGGLLIIGCSIALILSLWQTLESIPLFPFLAAALTTFALYGAGRYSLSHWKLESSSRGLLVIATLLVPLNFLVLAGISPRSNDPLEVGAKIGALLAFALMVRNSGRVLLPDPAGRRSRSGSWLLALAMVGPALTPLLAARAYDREGVTLAFALLIALPVACHAVAIAGAIVAHRRAKVVGIAATPVLGWVGFSFYSLAVSMAFLVFWVVSQGGAVSAVLGPLAGPAVIAGACILAAGLFVQRRAAAAPDEEERSNTVGFIATGVALLGGLIQVAAFGLAWPDRGSLLFVGLANYSILTAVAIRYRFPPAQMLALPSLLISFLAGVSLISSSGAPLGDNAGLTGTALAGLAIVLSIVADLFLRADRTLDGRAYQLAVGLIMLLSLGLVGADALSDPHWATCVGGAFAMVCLVLSRRWALPVLEQVGVALLSLTTVAALHWAIPGHYPAWGTVLALETLAFSVVRGHWWRPAALAAVLAGAAVVFGRADFHSGWNTATALVLAAGALVQAGRWRLMQLTWAGSALLLAGVAHGLILSAGTPLLLPWVTVLLVFASCTLFASLIGLRRSAYPLREVVALPLRWSGLAASIVAAANLLTGIEQSLLGPQSLFVSWLAILWLVAALSERDAPWFVAFQVAATFAVALGVGFVLQEQARAVGAAVSFTSATALYAFGLGLGGIALCWALLRRLLERRVFFRVFFAPANFFDQLLLGALIVGQLVLAGWLVIPEVVREVAPAGAVEIIAVLRPETLFALGTQPWLLLGLLGGALALSIRAADPKRTVVLLAGFGCLAISAPLLAAGRLAPQLASASALRWWLTAACILVASGFWLWKRRDEDTATESPGAILSIAIASGAIILSAISTMIILSGSLSAGPAAGSFFANMGWSLSHGLPAAAISVMLLGHAIRERNARYALAAGILLTLSAGFGYAVDSVLGGASFDRRIMAEVLQRATAAAALISAAWIVTVLIARRRAGQATETKYPPLWLAQQGIAASGNVLLLGGASLLLALATPALAGPTIPPTYPEASIGVTAVASSWGWAALILTIGAGWLGSSFTRRKVSPDVLALSLLGIVALVAAGIASTASDWAFRTLMYGAAGFALAASLAARRLEAFDRWVAIAGGVAIVLAAKATLVHGDSLAAVPAFAIASGAGLWLSFRRERADWACLAGVSVQLTVATGLWHGFRPKAIGDWATYLVQSCVATAAILMWFGRWLRDRGRAGPNLFTQFQQAVIGIGLAVLFGVSAAQLVIDPASNPTLLAQQSGAPSGLGMLLLAALSVSAFIRRYARSFLGDVLGAFAMLAIVWLALAVSGYRPGWPAYRALMAGMAVAALIAVFLKGAHSENWTRAFAIAVAGLALRAAWIDPLRPYFTAGAALLAAAVFSIHAIRRDRLADVWASCGLFSLAGFFVWVAWGKETAPQLIATESACVAAAAILWYVLARKFSVPFRESTIAAGAMLVALLAVWGIEETTSPATRQVPGDITWIAAALATVAALIGHAKPALRSASASLYSLSLCMVLFGLLQPRWPLEQMLRPAILALGCFVLVAQVIERVGSRRMDRLATQWFFSAQLGIAGIIVLLSLPACLGNAPTPERLAGPLSLGLIGVTIAVLAIRCSGATTRSLEHSVFGLVVLLCAEIGWAQITLNGSGAWLHGSISLLAALCLVALIAALLVPRLAAAENRWVQAARRTGPVLGALGAGVLGIVLSQEFYFFDRAAGGLPLSGFEAIAVAAAMIGLVATALTFAIRPGLDPFGLSGSGRKGYVYAAEAVLVLLSLHVRLSMPDFTWPPVGGLRWAFTLMLVAFAGIGLAEFFRRRNLEVLADPIHRTGIFLPLLPLMAFWLVPAPDGVPLSFQNYSLLWLTAGLLYGVLALTRRSYRYVLATALAMNAALWAFYTHEGIGFLVHPQVWLVPLALIVLVSEYFHRDRLSPELASGLRYGGLVMLYVSSMADVFVAGPNESAPLLLVLAALSVISVFAGILLRVRAYLFLGSGFLTLVVFRMIWHAAVEREQTWVWWACGIVLGILVLTLFAVLERCGQQVRDALQRIRQWR